MKPKTKKIIRRSIIGFVAFMVIAVVAAVLWMDWAIKTTITEVGSRAFGTKVEVKTFRSRVLRGKIVLDKMVIANPEGYQSERAFAFEQFLVKLDPSSLLSPKIVVEEVLIDGLHIDFEPKINGSTNLTDLKANLEKFIGKKPGDKPAEKVDSVPAEKKEGGKKVVIRKLTVSNAKMTLSSSLIKSSIPIPLLTIELKDIGEKEDVTLVDSVYIVFNKILQSVFDAAKGVNLKNIGDGAAAVGGGIVDGAGKVGGGVSDAVSTISSFAKDLVTTKESK